MERNFSSDDPRASKRYLYIYLYIFICIYILVVFLNLFFSFFFFPEWRIWLKRVRTDDCAHTIPPLVAQSHSPNKAQKTHTQKATSKNDHQKGGLFMVPNSPTAPSPIPELQQRASSGVGSLGEVFVWYGKCLKRQWRRLRWRVNETWPSESSRWWISIRQEERG